MNQKLIRAAVVTLPVIVGGLVFANAQKQAPPEKQPKAAAGYICPITGEELPCPLCCPLKK